MLLKTSSASGNFQSFPYNFEISSVHSVRLSGTVWCWQARRWLPVVVAGPGAQQRPTVSSASLPEAEEQERLRGILCECGR